MFDEAYTKLELEEIAIILDVINNKIDGSIFDPLETTILSINIPFYPGYKFLDISDNTTNPPLKRYVVQKIETQDFSIIDWNYKTIYDLNSKVPIFLSDDNILEYIRFYFSYVKGRHGRFIICETADHVQWKEDPPQEIKKSLNQILSPLKIIEKRQNNIYIVDAFMMLKDTLFNVQIYVDSTGKVTMSDHNILMENIPVFDINLMSS